MMVLLLLSRILVLEPRVQLDPIDIVDHALNFLICLHTVGVGEVFHFISQSSFNVGTERDGKSRMPFSRL